MILELCVLFAPQNFEVDEWFRLHPTARNGAVVISANRREASAERAMRELVRAMEWRVQAESDAGIKKLAPVSLDLAFKRRDPRTVAQWIAATAGLEVRFEDDNGNVVMSLAEARSGKPRELRRRAIRWYEKILDADSGSIAGAARLEALMGLGDALEDAGEFTRAATVYDRVYEEDGGRRFAKRALLRASAVHLALAARSELPELKRKAHLQLAEETARRLLQLNPEALRVDATLQLGRVLAQAGRWRDCVCALEADDSVSSVGISLLLAEAFAREGQPSRAVDALDALTRLPALTWNREQFRDYHRLRGVSNEVLSREPGDEGTKRDRLLDAMRSLEAFVGSTDADDPRRSRAMIALGRVYFETGRHIEARAAALRVLAARSRLSEAELQAVRILEARTSFAVGAHGAAFDQLEMTARSDPEGMAEIVLFLADSLVKDGQYDRAIASANLLVGRGPHADEARCRKTLAMWKRAKRRGMVGMVGMVEEFVEEAGPIVASIGAASVRARAAAILAEAHEELGQHEQAVALHPSVRTMFGAGQFAEVLRRAGAIEEDEDAPLADVFRVGRCHAELHSRATTESLAAKAAAAEAKRAGAAAAAAAAAIRAAHRHTRSERGDFASVSRYEKLLALQESAGVTHALKIREFEEKKRSAARHLERAHDIFVGIERCEVGRVGYGECGERPWSKAAQSAREMMRWIDESGTWTAPRIRWTIE